MEMESIEAGDGPPAGGGYSQAVAVSGARRWVYVSGQIPEEAGGGVPERFEEQCRLVWKNVERQLVAAGTGLDGLVKVTTFLSDRRWRDANSRIRREVLGDRRPALTIIVCDIYAEEWLLEIEAVAVA